MTDIPSSSQPAGVAQLVEFQPSKLAVEGSNPFSRSNGPDADGRSSGLQPHRLGSIPTVSTIIRWSVHLGVRIQGFHPCHTGSNPVPTTPCQGR